MGMGSAEGRRRSRRPTATSRSVVALVALPLLLSPSPSPSGGGCHAFVRLVHRSAGPALAVPPPSPRRPPVAERDRIRTRLRQLGLGSAGDYLSNLSANDDRRDDGAEADSAGGGGGETASGRSPMATARSALSGVSTEVERRTAGMASGLAGAAERGGSDLRRLADEAKNGAERVAKRGTRDVRRTTLGAQKLAKRTAGGLTGAGRGLADAGQGFYDMHFFEELSSSSKVKAEEVARWIDAQARSGSEAVSSQTKTLVLNFTGKNEYRFGDISKELVRRVASHDVNMQDAILLLKILLALGATIGPLAELLPFTFLIEAVNISLEQKVGGKILEVLSKSLDSRLVAALFTTDDKNLIGDVVKRTVLGGVLEFTGKSNYEPGDIQRAVEGGREGEGGEDRKLELDISSEFEEWDRMFVEKIETEDYVGNQARIMDMKIAMALEECEAISQSKYDSR